MSEPDWLEWAREVQAIAQTGLAFKPHQYDRERYEALQALAARMMASRSDTPAVRIEGLFGAQTGYATPKVDVRGAVFDGDRLLLVREVSDQGRWTLPGGWADVNFTAQENIVREVSEESGFLVKVTKVAAVLDRTRQGHTPQPFSAYKLFFLCDILGGAAAVSHETSEVAFFAEHELPADISTERTTLAQLRRMFEHARQPELPTDFD
jgi:ADP-ribose pyrophosphatase YjhB (NUDIX family)